MKHNVWYGPGTPEVRQSWALSIDSRNKIGGPAGDLEGRIGQNLDVSL